MKTIGAFEAKTHLSRLLDEVEAGDEITITKHGKPVARIVPVGNTTASAAAVKRLKELSRAVKLDGLSMKEMIAEGRKY